MKFYGAKRIFSEPPETSIDNINAVWYLIFNLSADFIVNVIVNGHLSLYLAVRGSLFAKSKLDMTDD